MSVALTVYFMCKVLFYMRIVYDVSAMNAACIYTQGCVRLGLVLGRQPTINLFGLHYSDICCEVETKYVTLTRNVTINDTHEKITPF